MSAGDFLTCWHDASRGMRRCKRQVASVNVNGYAVAGCLICKTLLGEAVGPATPACEPSDGWREIPPEYMPRY